MHPIMSLKGTSFSLRLCCSLLLVNTVIINIKVLSFLVNALPVASGTGHSLIAFVSAERGAGMSLDE